jgi:hypothetical protein
MASSECAEFGSLGRIVTHALYNSPEVSRRPLANIAQAACIRTSPPLLAAQRLGDPARRPMAPRTGRPAVLILLAGKNPQRPGHAGHAGRSTLVRIQLLFLGKKQFKN